MQRTSSSLHHAFALFSQIISTPSQVGHSVSSAHSHQRGQSVSMHESGILEGRSSDRMNFDSVPPTLVDQEPQFVPTHEVRQDDHTP